MLRVAFYDYTDVNQYFESTPPQLHINILYEFSTGPYSTKGSNKVFPFLPISSQSFNGASAIIDLY